MKHDRHPHHGADVEETRAKLSYDLYYLKNRSLLLDIFVFFISEKVDRMFSRRLVNYLNAFVDRPWVDLKRGKQITEQWLAQQLRPYGIRPRTIRIGEERAKGYYEEDLREAFKRYIPRAELNALAEEAREAEEEQEKQPPEEGEEGGKGESE